jgi:ferritin
MVTIKVKENSKQAKLFLEYIKTLSFVEFIETSVTKVNYTSMDEIVDECKKSRKKIAKVYNEKD